MADYPKILYHYTTQQGFLGIVKERAIWASGIQHLNDSSEFRYAIDLALGILREMELPAEIKEQLQGVISTLHLIFDVFVASFSADGDQLGQWRAYGESGGVSIGFDVEKMSVQAVLQNYNFVQCNYVKSEQEAALRPIIEWAATEPLSLDMAKKFLRKFMPLVTRVKHPSFRVEDEYRLAGIHSAPNNSRNKGTEYRTGKSVLIPYKLFPLTPNSEWTLPIREIVIGPTPHPDLAAVTVFNFLCSQGLTPDDFTVRQSEIPYRDW